MFRLYDKPNTVQTEVKFEVSFDSKLIERNVYNVFDVLKDAGGLSSSLFSGFTLIVLAVTFNNDRIKYSSMIYTKKTLARQCIENGTLTEQELALFDKE